MTEAPESKATGSLEPVSTWPALLLGAAPLPRPQGWGRYMEALSQMAGSCQWEERREHLVAFRHQGNARISPVAPEIPSSLLRFLSLGQQVDTVFLTS